MMRLDKYLADSGIFSRSEAGRAVRSGRIAVNGAAVRDPSAKVDELTAAVTVDGQALDEVQIHYAQQTRRLCKHDGR